MAAPPDANDDDGGDGEIENKRQYGRHCHTDEWDVEVVEKVKPRGFCIRQTARRPSVTRQERGEQRVHVQREHTGHHCTECDVRATHRNQFLYVQVFKKDHMWGNESSFSIIEL